MSVEVLEGSGSLVLVVSIRVLKEKGGKRESIK